MRKRADGLRLGGIARLVCASPECGQPFSYEVTMGRNPKLCPDCQADAHRAVVRLCNRRAKLRQYNLTIEDFDAMLRTQRHRCACCRTTDNRNREFAVDHDHSCCPVSQRSCGKCVRGLLCRLCNTNNLSDDMVLQKAAYILYWRTTGLSSGAEHIEHLRKWVVVQAATINIEPVQIGVWDDYAS